MPMLARPLVVVSALAFVTAPIAAQPVFWGFDVNGGRGGPRTNADAKHAEWLAAAGGLTATETFEGFPPLPTSTPPLPLAGGMVLLSEGASIAMVFQDQTDELGYNTTAGGERYFRFAPSFTDIATLHLVFPRPVRAFGAYYTGVAGWAGSTAVLFGGEKIPLWDTDPGMTHVAGVQFLGFLSPEPVTFADIVGVPNNVGPTRDVIGIDDIQFFAPVPEPSTIALTGGGVLLIGAAIRRRRG